MTFYRDAPCGYVVMKAMANRTSAKFICPAALGCGLDVEQGPTLPFPSFKGPGHKASLFEYVTGDATFTHAHRIHQELKSPARASETSIA